MWTLVIDDFSRYINPAQEPFTILTPTDVGCDEFTHMALRYSVLELSTAVKPWLLRHLLAATGQAVTYLDPDIRIYGSLQHLDELAESHGVVLIPHNSKPIPQDGRKPSQVDVMISGTYNLGYVSLAPRPEVDWLLDWWADRLRRDCRVDPVWGYFVDQRWFDPVPAFLSDLAIVRDPEYNLAYWNLHERRLVHEDGRYLVDGRPLSFFHFSGFDPEQPLRLSRYQDRIDVLDQPVLERLLAGYAAEVMSEGHAVSRHWPYLYERLPDGTQPDDRIRELFDEFADEHAGAVASPFTIEGAHSFNTWLRGQAPGAPPGISRALARIYEDRADVKGAFPDLAGADLAALLNWAGEQGAAEEPVLARLTMNGIREAVAPAAGSEPSRQPPRFAPAKEPSAPLRAAPWGVNVVGEFCAQSEIEEVARAVVSALDSSGVRALPVRSRSSAPSSAAPPYATVVSADAPFSLNVICLDPGRLSEFRQEAGWEFFAGRYSVGLWLAAPQRARDPFSEHVSLLEEIWAPSAHAAIALRELTTPPVQVIRIPVMLPALARTRAELGLAQDKFLFHLRVDYRESFERQNPVAVIDAFRTAFAAGENAGLVLDCLNADSDQQAHARLCSAAAPHDGILVLDDDRSLAVARAVTSVCNCYVSLHRATTFGLAMAEAMWSATPVIATGYSGNLDFMSRENSYLVDHRLVPVEAGDAADSPHGGWAEPDVAHAATLMQRAFENREATAALGATAAKSIRRTHSPQVAGEIMRRRSESIRATGRARAAANPIASHPPALSRLPMRIRQGPRAASSGRAQSARRQLRRVVLRLMRPYTSYQQTVNSEIVAALSEFSREIVGSGDRARADWADMLAAMRLTQQVPPQLDAQTSGIEEIKRILTLQTDRGAYLALSELEDRHAKIDTLPGQPPVAAPLTSFELRVFSENGEDGVLAEILRRIGAPARYFVEFGIESGREGNCVYLADAAGWQGLFMESDHELFAALQGKYAAHDQIRTLRAQVSGQNVENLFTQAGVPTEPDVLSIDIDGQDYWIWKAIENHQPRVVIIEYNSALDPRRRLVQPEDPGYAWDGTDYYGASLGALQALAQGKGYRLVHTELSGNNAFFVRGDVAGDVFGAPADVAVRAAPNYHLRGAHHPAAGPGRRYLDLDSGKLIRREDLS